MGTQTLVLPAVEVMLALLAVLGVGRLRLIGWMASPIPPEEGTAFAGLGRSRGFTVVRSITD